MILCESEELSTDEGNMTSNKLDLSGDSTKEVESHHNETPQMIMPLYCL